MPELWFIDASHCFTSHLSFNVLMMMSKNYTSIAANPETSGVSDHGLFRPQYVQSVSVLPIISLFSRYVQQIIFVW